MYDAWGNHKVLDASGNVISSSSHIGNVNPFRYRGYFYDIETGLYYLKTRYYDPVTGRFLNMDSIDYADPETINGLNLYAYCGNNPVTNVDPDGHFGIIATLLISVVVGAVISSATEIVKQLANNDGDISEINWRKVGSSALNGAALGIAIGLGGAVGATIKGVASLSITIGQATVIALGANFAAGVGSYLIEYAGSDNFNGGLMLIQGLSQTGKGAVNFMFGGMLGASGLWGIGKGVSKAGVIARSIGKAITTFIPFKLFDFLEG